MVAVAAAAMKRASTDGRTDVGDAAAALSNDIMERSEQYSSSKLMLAYLPPSFLSPASGAINSFAFAVKCFACLMSLTFHSDDSFSFCSVDMSTPCMSLTSMILLDAVFLLAAARRPYSYASLVLARSIQL